MKKICLLILILSLLILSFKKEGKANNILFIDKNIISYEVDLKKQQLKFYWKNKEGKNYKNFQSLKTELAKQHKNLIFAMNGGMFKKDFSPQGLYIENSKFLSKLDTLQNGYGNFYMQPNGVFYITDNNAYIIKSKENIDSNVKYATQSGPMLIVEGELHPKFRKFSKNIHIRNGVGILPNGNLLFAMSKEKVNFYNFATFFKKNGCQNALYLDGFVSKMYLPTKHWEQLDGNFGVIIGVEEKY